MRKFFTLLTPLFLLCATLFSGACSEDEAVITPEGRLVSNVVITTAMDVYKGMPLTINGRGFQEGDQITLRAASDIPTTLTSLDEKNLVVAIPDQVVDQTTYRFVLYRGEEYQVLGASKLTVKLAINLSIPATISAERGEKVTLRGNGFNSSDKLQILQGGGSHEVTITEVDANSITFVIPRTVVAGSCELQLTRGTETQLLGSTKLSLKVPDKENATIKGIVLCDGIGVPNVLVSDGDLIAKTDEDGYYWLESKKRNNLVFLILPSGYDVPTKKAIPQFWQPCTLDAKKLEQIDFELSKSANDAHTMLVATDIHLANRNTDLKQFANGFIKEVTTAYNASASKVYCLNLGDFSWDGYWYSNSWAIPDCKTAIKDLNFQFWSTMGNHDNDARVPNDFLAEGPFRINLGPVYYAMNIGKVHYIMLDDTYYVNSGATSTANGDREYERRFTDEQIAWLKEELKYVPKTTPIVVGCHCPIYSYSIFGSTTVALEKGSQAEVDKILSCFEGYTSVNILTGHTHVNRSIQSPTYANVYEQNVAAVCGSWWWTNQYAQNNVCTDGSPAGYKVFEVNGTDIKWHYKAVGQPATAQFMTYDMNVVKNHWATDPTALKAFAAGNDLKGRQNDYTSVGSNVVYINVWGYEPSWNISVTEGAKALDIKQVWTARDPLHSISYDIPRGATNNGELSFPSTYCMHMFAVTASAPDTSLEISVTDRFGKVYKQTMTRPKALTTSIN